MAVALTLACGGCERFVDAYFHTQSDDGAVALPAGLNPASLNIQSGTRHLGAHYVRASGPTAPLLLILHGNGENVADWGGAQLLLRDHGFSSIVFDYSGFGRSTGTATINHFREDVLAAYARACTLAPAGQGVAIVAHSLGTFIALDAEAMMQPPPPKLVLWGVFAGLRRDIAWNGGWGRIEAWLVPDRWDNMVEITSAHVPTLILHGDADTVVPEAETAALAKIAGTSATYVHVPGAGHNALYKGARDVAWQPVLAFLQR